MRKLITSRPAMSVLLVALGVILLSVGVGMTFGVGVGVAVGGGLVLALGLLLGWNEAS